IAGFAIAWLTIAAQGHGAILGITTGIPDLYSQPVSVKYTAGSANDLKVWGTAARIDFDGTGLHNVMISGGNLSIDVQVDHLTGKVIASQSNAFTVTGSLTAGGPSVTLLSGSLLSSPNVPAFGYANDGSEFDFRFSITGGSLASNFAGVDLGFVVKPGAWNG